ncbi:MAG: hypothetical protein AAF197_03750 [Pseudomonadota bacterium]
MATQYSLQRRGVSLGHVTIDDLARVNAVVPQKWQTGQPILMRSAAKDAVLAFDSEIARSAELYQTALHDESIDSVIDSAPYQARWQNYFEPLGSSVNPAEKQEIETLFFDAIDQEQSVAEDLWLKISWLSYYAADQSLRFRFSFGVDHEEDVAADALRQAAAADLCDVFFPESKAITANEELNQLLLHELQCDDLQFVERIVYFNAPDGGAYLHHDLERGHAGVVYLQASGETCWIAIPKSNLLEEITTFANHCEATNSWPVNLADSDKTEIQDLCQDQDLLDVQINLFSNDSLIKLINETEDFVQRLIAQGHAYHLRAGDMIILPQITHPPLGQIDEEIRLQNCCWHSVFCLGDQVGQGLSFAIKAS